MSELALKTQEDLDNDNSIHQPKSVDISHILAFLDGETPQKWLDEAVKNLPIIIQDHANCEKSRWHSDEFNLSLSIART